MKLKIGEYEEELDRYGNYLMKDWESKFEKAKIDVCLCLNEIKDENHYSIMIKLFGCLDDMRFENDTLIFPDYCIYYGMDVVFKMYFGCRIIQMHSVVRALYNPLKNDDIVKYYLEKYKDSDLNEPK